MSDTKINLNYCNTSLYLKSIKYVSNLVFLGPIKSCDRRRLHGMYLNNKYMQ